MSAPATTPIAVTDETFEQEVLGSDKPVLVDFWAVWCGPCKMIDPVLAEIATEYADRLKIVKLNIDTDPMIPARYGVLGAPTLNLYKDGEVVQQIVGAKPKRQLLKLIEPYL